MWVVKFQFDGSEILYGRYAKKFNGVISGYNLSSYERGKRLYVNSAGRFLGEHPDKSKFMNFLKKDKHILKLEEHEGFFIVLVEEDYSFKPFYSSSFVYLSPVIINKEGLYSFHIGSWHREDIEKLLKKVEGFEGYKLLSLKQERIKDISLTGIRPNLTEKQKKAYELAVEKGYYEYPKKIDLKQLAKLAGVSYSTFQQHLKYAEKKVSNFFFNKK